MNINKNKKISGHSLIELVVAMYILSIIMLGLVGVFSFRLATITESEESIQLAFLTQQKIEELKSKEFSARKTADELQNTNPDTPIKGNFGEELNEPDYNKYAYSLEIEDVVTNPNDPTVSLLKHITIKSTCATNPQVKPITLDAYVGMYDTKSNIRPVGGNPFPKPLGTHSTSVIETPAPLPNINDFPKESKFYPVAIYDNNQASSIIEKFKDNL